MIPDSIIDRTKKLISKGLDWTEFQKQIRNGECLRISAEVVHFLKSCGVDAKQVRGFVKYPFRVVSNDIHEAETDELRHWWVEVDGRSYEFARGSLVNGVLTRNGGTIGEFDDYESVDVPSGFTYFPETYIG